jgi:MFS family permease
VPALKLAAPSAAQATLRLNRSFVAALMLANFGTNVALIAPIENILPRMIESVSGAEDKAIGLGLVTGLGAFAALIFNPLAGHYSDRWVSADNRTTLILIGLITGGVAHVVLGFQQSLIGIAVWWTLCQATINIAYAPMSAIVVDHVDRRSWGLVWGLISGAQAVGLIFGLAAVVLVFPSVTGGMIAIAVTFAVCLVPLLLVLYRLPRISYALGGADPVPVALQPHEADRENHDRIRAAEANGHPSAEGCAVLPEGRTAAAAGPAAASAASCVGSVAGDGPTPAYGCAASNGSAPNGSAANGSAAGAGAGSAAGSGRARSSAGSADWLATTRALLSAGQGFGLVWLGKFLVTLAETIALLYLYYYLQDVVHYRNPGQGQLILVVIATVAVIIATVAVGRVADLSNGYRRYAVLSSLLMAATGFVLAGYAAWGLVIVASLALGAGYGAFQSVSQALSLVVLPSPANAGRDLGIINIASAVPQVIGAPVAGLVVAEAGGYRGLFVFAGLLALAAAAVFTRVPSTSPTAA